MSDPSSGRKTNLFRKFLHNKVIFYVFSRYLISAVSFLTSLLLALKLSPFYLGIWGAIMLVRRYFQLVNFGIPDSASVLIVQNFDDKNRTEIIESTSVFLTFILGALAIITFVALSAFQFPFIEKYELNEKWLFICVVVVFTYFNDLFFKIYRTKGKVAELTFYQSIAQILCFIAIFVARDARLVWILLLCYMVGYMMAFLVFIRGKSICFKLKRISFQVSKQIISKGFFLFLYNTSFYFIMLSTRSFISSCNSVNNFGLFTFSFTLSNGVIVLLDALSSLIMPKMIDKFLTGDENAHKSILGFVKDNYIFLSFFISFAIIAILPLALEFFPAYHDTFSTICYLTITSSVFSCCYGLTSYLMAKNHERVLALLALIVLAVNVVLTFFVTKYFPGSIEYPCIVVLFSYFLFLTACYWTFKKKSGYRGVKMSEICLSPVFVIPAVAALVISFFKLYYLSVIPALIFVLMGYKNVSVLYASFVKLLNKPNIIDIHHDK